MNHDPRNSRREPQGGRAPRTLDRIRGVLLAMLVGCVVAAGGALYFLVLPESAQSSTQPDADPVTAAGSEQPPPGPFEPIAPPLTLSTTVPEVTSLADSFGALSPLVDGEVGVAIAPIGKGSAELFGDVGTGPAWSTSKVPVVMAAEREHGSLTASMAAAITRSDNAAAEEVWTSLGVPETAAAKVEAVLREAGVSTVVQSERIRPGYTAFGQTIWSLQDQATFVANAACDPRSASVLNLMGQIEPGQSWGLGRIPGSKFKGGWGPSESGAYLVRQFGLVPTTDGEVAIAIAVRPASGSFEAGTQALDIVADWIADHLSQMPLGRCA
ncbi:hypothetical protein FHR72_001104 [Mycolicibacterium iranicum]|uniref:Serine hydrolase n=1 Tax=Mycolicibacterium iranicum TaxID=912594 RepID=A0A839QAQ7_MYCIR|nr:hypothetical protein [Mycolicibacterium iranicum]